MLKRFIIGLISAAMMVSMALQSSASANDGKLYSIGMLSDVHIDGDGDDESHSISDMHRALNKFRDSGINNVCISGDVTHDGRKEDLQAYRDIKNAHGDMNIYATRGNHDNNNHSADLGEFTKYVESNGLYFEKNINGDVYLFVGMARYDYENPFTDDEMNWLEGRLEAYKNQRVFVIEHLYIPPTGDVASLYKGSGMGTSNTSQRYRDLMNKYKNVIMFSGHSHLNFDLERISSDANVSQVTDNLCAQVHVPSCAKPRNNDAWTPDVEENTYTFHEGSQGYIMDVYQDKVVLKAIDFATDTVVKEYTIPNYSGSIPAPEPAPAPAPAPAPEPAPEPAPDYSNLEVIQGQNRYETAALLSQSSFDSADTVVLVNGAAMADGLCATPLALEVNGPILLVEKDRIPEATLNEINRLNPSNIIVVGGTGVISDELANSLGRNIQRLGGANRYETSLAIATHLDTMFDVDTVAIANGYGEADAMSISPFSHRLPIILVEKNNMLNTTREWLLSEELVWGFIIGGEGVVNQTFPFGTERLGGANRYETNSSVINKFNPSNTLYVTKGLELVDALTAGVIAGRNDSPVVLVDGNLKDCQNGLNPDKVIQVGNPSQSAVDELLRRCIE